MQNLNNFKDLVKSDLREYIGTGNLLHCNVLIHIVALLEWPDLVRDEGECLAALKTFKTLEKQKQFVCLDFDLIPQAANAEESEEIIDKYIKLFTLQ